MYIGDETRDIEAVKECGIKVVAVTWGYNARQPLVDKGARAYFGINRG